MKYCKKCGMLLEDTHQTCIRCGADVTLAENVSMYPIEVMETIEEENQRKKASGKIVAMIIGLVTVLVVLVLLFMNGLGGSMTTGSQNTDEAQVQTAAAASEQTASPEPALEETPVSESAQAPEETPAPTPEPSKRKVKDDKGRYYNYVVETDDADNPVFTAVIPEDLTEIEFYKDYEGYCDRYPFMMNFSASTKENDVRFTYLSPRKLWYKISETGKSRTDLRDLTYYMTYLKYDGPTSYLDALMAQSYPGAKFELKNEYDVSDGAVEFISALAKERNKQLFRKEIGDLGHIGEGTTYANMDYESSAKVYEYEVTLPDKEMLFCKYYIPSMAFNLTYANTDQNDRGNLTEWYNFAIICLECGNEDDYDDYKEAFDMFIYNALPTQQFMFINESYSKEIKDAVDKEDSPDPLDNEKLSKFGKAYKPDSKLDDFDTKVMGLLSSAGKTCFAEGDVTLYGNDKDKVAFYDATDNKVFLSDEEDEYPGDSFTQLQSRDMPKLQAETSDEAAEEPDEAAEASDSEEDSENNNSGVN